MFLPQTSGQMFDYILKTYYKQNLYWLVKLY